MRAIFGTTAGAAAILIEDATDTSAAAAADTNIALTDVANVNTAAAGSVASSFGAGSQKAADATLG